MTAPPLRLSGSTRADRHETVSRVRDAINASGGALLDFKMFSNVSICLNFEIPARHVARLRSALGATPLRLDAESAALLARFDEETGTDTTAIDLPGTLQITFIHDDPDLIIAVPPIPG